MSFMYYAMLCDRYEVSRLDTSSAVIANQYTTRPETMKRTRGCIIPRQITYKTKKPVSDNVHTLMETFIAT